MIFDWKKYKRFFTFGCSFTNYMWPSWADIVHNEMPNAEFFNFGISGSGNTLISYRIAEANNRYVFTDTDLIMVMFTTYCREDRWISPERADQINAPGPGWQACGNIFNNELYPKNWVRDFADETGYLIRDAAVIDLTMKYLENIPSTAYAMLSTPFVTNADSYDVSSQTPYELRAVYENTFNKFGPSFFEFYRKELSRFQEDYSFSDGHPAPYRYYEYLKHIGINLSDETKKYAYEASDVLKSIKSREAVTLYFPEVSERTSQSRKALF